jgi:hypothetical protein
MFRQRCRYLGSTPTNEQSGSAGIIEHIVDLSGAEAIIDRHQIEPRALRGPVNIKNPGIVVRQQSHYIAASQARVVKPVRKT